MSWKNLIVCILFAILILNFVAFFRRRFLSHPIDHSTSNNHNIINSIITNYDSQTTTNSIATSFGMPKPISTYSLVTEFKNPFTDSLQTFLTTSYPSSVTGHSKEQLTFKTWKDTSSNTTHRLFVFSAWMDGRRLDDIDVLRIVAIASVVENLHQFLDCSFFFENGDTETVEAISSVATGSYLTIRNKLLQGYVLTCPASSPPERVHLYFRSENKSFNIKQSIEIEGQHNSHKKKHELTACVFANFISDKISTMIDNMDEYRVLEWMVTQRMLGVQHMTVYVNQINPRHARILSTLFSYSQANRGFLSIRSYNYIFKHSGKDVHNLHSSSVASDCFFSYMKTSRRVMLVGFEEVLIPRRRLKLLSLLRNLENLSIVTNRSLHISNQIPSLVFNIEYFFANFLPRFDITPYSIILRYVLKSNVINLDQKAKTLKTRSVVSTSTCVIIDFNQCKILGRNSPNGSIYFVPESMASFHSYESCDDEIFDCQSALASYVIDKSILNFEKILVERLRSNVIYFFKHNL